MILQVAYKHNSVLL